MIEICLGNEMSCVKLCVEITATLVTTKGFTVLANITKLSNEKVELCKCGLLFAAITMDS